MRRSANAITKSHIGFDSLKRVLRDKARAQQVSAVIKVCPTCGCLHRMPDIYCEPKCRSGVAPLYVATSMRQRD